jgi:hypothetical protein
MTKAKRPPIPTPIQRSVKTKNLGVCCVCKERGLGINLHHIDSNPFNNSENNIGDPDTPNLINEFNLPITWEKH